MDQEYMVQKDDTTNIGKKRKYQSPLLTRYGALRDLTQSGSGATTETKGNEKAKRPASDRNVKENIVRIGEHPLGIGLYLFDYRPAFRDEWGCGRQFGVIAQEVEAVMPEAVVVHPDGYKTVDYDMLGISRHIQ